MKAVASTLDFRGLTDRMGRTWRSYPPLLIISFLVLGILVFVALSAGWLMPHELGDQDLLNRYKPPVFLAGGGWEYPLGTDGLGQDMLTLMLRSIQVSMSIAFLGTLFGAAAGTLIGFAAACFGGAVDSVVGVLVDFQAALPFLVLALALLAVMPNADMGMFIILMCIYGWERYARLARGLAIAAQEQGYALSQRSLGASSWRIYFRHILPNIAAVLMVNMSLNFPATILTETSLNFLGVGIEPPDTSLGVLMGQGRSYLYKAPWIALMPGLVIFLTTFAMSIVGDWLRDRLDAGSR
jgi:peptide/nickel transport system permease protein